MPFKSIPLWRLQKYKKIVTSDFDNPDALADTPTPSRPAGTGGKGATDGDKMVPGGVIIYIIVDLSIISLLKT